MKIFQINDRRSIGAEIYARVAQVVFNGIFVVKTGSVRSTAPFGVVNGLYISAAVFDTGNVVFGDPADGLAQFFSVSRKDQRNITTGGVVNVVRQI